MGEGGVIEGRVYCPSHKIFDILVIATLNFAEFCVAEFDIYCTSKQ